jgi:hypothetical protein
MDLKPLWLILETLWNREKPSPTAWTAWKNIFNLVELQSSIAKCYKVRKLWPREVGNFCNFEKSYIFSPRVILKYKKVLQNLHKDIFSLIYNISQSNFETCKRRWKNFLFQIVLKLGLLVKVNCGIHYFVCTCIYTTELFNNDRCLHDFRWRASCC